MLKSELKNVLKSHNLRVTGCRLDTLNFIMSSDKAVSKKELSSHLSLYDPATLYRTLQSFVEKGILHVIQDGSGSSSYAVCLDTCTPENHNHNHVHFKCRNCGDVECLEAYPQIGLNLKGYKVEEVQTIVHGICKSCTI